MGNGFLRERLCSLKERFALILAQLRPDIRSEKRWLVKARRYWLDSWRSDPRGKINSPEAYWAKGSADCNYTRDLLAAVAEVFQQRHMNRGSFLEIGCNAGRNLYNLQLACPGSRIVGIDINRDALDFAKHHVPGAEGRDWITGDITKEDTLKLFPSGSLDIVFSMAVMAHIPPGAIKERVISHCLRISKVALIMIEPHTEGRVVWNVTRNLRASPLCIDNYKRYIVNLPSEIRMPHYRPDDIYRVIIVKH